MSTLQENLDRIREDFEGQVPAEVLSIMHRATEDLRASELVARIPAPGDRLPAFELPDTEGKLVRSADLLGSAPLVLTFYRGVW